MSLNYFRWRLGNERMPRHYLNIIYPVHYPTFPSPCINGLNVVKGKYLFFRRGNKTILGHFNLFFDPWLEATLQENGITFFNEIVRICRTWHGKQLARLLRAWLDCFTLLKLGVVACILAILWENGWMDIHSGGVAFKPCMQDLFFYFLDPRLLDTYRKNR